MWIDWLPLVIGFGLGFMHALDADHVMAVSALANQKPSRKRTLWFSLHWALGHGGVLVGCGLMLLGIGMTIPEYLQQTAEVLVGIVLIVLGVSFLWKFQRLNIQLVKHRHQDIEHIHWVTNQHDSHEQKMKGKYHQPVMVGMLHGLAGSAPALALIPTVVAGQLISGVIYLLIFSVGVALSMLVFGLGFSCVQGYLYQHYQRLFILCRYLIAAMAIGFGCFWVVQAV